MNGKSLTGAAAVLLSGCLFTAAAGPLKSWLASPETPVILPAVPDSVAGENPFKPEALLGARTGLPDNLEAAGWTTLVADSTGTFGLVTPQTAPLLRSYRTSLRSPRFAKGKLKLKSTGRVNVNSGGKTLISKNEPDSTAFESTAEIMLLPEADYDISVELLAMPGEKANATFSLEFVPDDPFKGLDIISGPELKGRVMPVTTMTGERITSASLSDNGKYIIVVSRDVVSGDETQWYARLLTADGKTVSGDIPPSAKWMPGQQAFYTMRSEKGNHDLYRTEVPSMKTERLAKGLPESKVMFSPDCRRIFYYKEVKGDAGDATMHRYKTPDDRIPGDRDRNYIMCYNLDTHVSTPVTWGGGTTSVYSFTPDGGKMLYGVTVNTPSEYPFYNTTLIQLDLGTLATDTIAARVESTVTGACYSPDAKSVFIEAGPAAFGGIGANYAPHPIGNDFDTQGYILDIATGVVKAVTRDFDPALQPGAVWNRADGKIYFIAEKGFGRNLYVLDPTKETISELKGSVDFVRNFSMGDNEKRWIAYTGGSFTRDGAAYVMDLQSGKSRLVADPLSEVTANIEFGRMEPWQFTASDGTLVDGYACYPPDFDPEKKYPLIVYYYGGTSPSTASFYHLYSPQVFASRDYVVYVLNPSGTTGYGQEYSARHVNAWGKRTAEEIIEGTKLFCKDHPFIDSKKIGCIGASYGGFMTQYLQTLTDLFAAAVSHAGISNVTSYWGEGYWGYSYNSVAAAKSYPWSDPGLYTKQGSLFNADKIHTPLLLLHGTVDTNVPIGESIQLFNALKILGREVEFITVEGENHVISGFDNKILWQNTIMAWFAKWLQDDPSWWNELYK